MCCSTLNQSALRCTSSFSCESPAARPNNVEQWTCQSGSFMTDVPQSRGRRAVRVQLILAALLAWVAGSSWEFDSNSVLWLYFWDNWSLSAPRDSSHLASSRAGPMRNGCCCMFKKKKITAFFSFYGFHVLLRKTLFVSSCHVPVKSTSISDSVQTPEAAVVFLILMDQIDIHFTWVIFFFC